MAEIMIAQAIKMRIAGPPCWSHFNSTGTLTRKLWHLRHAGGKKVAGRSERPRLRMTCCKGPGLCYLIVVIVPCDHSFGWEALVATLIGASSFYVFNSYLAAPAAWRCCEQPPALHSS